MFILTVYIQKESSVCHPWNCRHMNQLRLLFFFVATVYQLKIKYDLDKFKFLDAKSAASFPLEDKHVVNEHHVLRKCDEGGGVAVCSLRFLLFLVRLCGNQVFILTRCIVVSNH